MMQRRQVMAALAAPAVAGLAGCAAPGAGAGAGVTLHEAGAPLPEMLWQQLPANVLDAFQNNPALHGQPLPGMATLSAGRRLKDGATILLGDRRWSAVGGALEGVTLGTRAADYTLRYFKSELILEPFINIADVQMMGVGNMAWRINADASRICSEIEAEGSLWPMRPGARRRISGSWHHPGIGLPPAGVAGIITEVERSYTQVQLWREVALWRLQIFAARFLLNEPSFLRGTHHAIRHTQIEIGGGTAPHISKHLFSDIYAYPVLSETSNGTWNTQLIFGEGTTSVPLPLAGERLELSASGAARLAAAQEDLQAEQALMVAAGAFVAPAQRAAALRHFQRGQGLYQARDYAAAMVALDEGILLDPGHAPAHVLFADSIRRVPPRPSTRALAADRLARFHLDVALTINPDGPAGRAAREALAGLPAA